MFIKCFYCNNEKEIVMIQIRRLIALVLLILAIGLAANAQTYTRSGNTFISSTGERVKAEPVKTKFTWKDNKGHEYPVYISSKGSCFVIKGKDKNGKDKKTYLGPESLNKFVKNLVLNIKVIKESNPKS